MKIISAIIGALIGIGVVAAIKRLRRITPDTMIVKVRSNGKAWTDYSGCLLDAQMEGWRWGVTRRGEIIRIQTGEPTGRRFVQIKK